MSAVHHAAQQGFSSQADAYARGRPDYPEALDGWLKQALGLGPGRQVADVGAGTGKFTPRLVRTGAEVAAVEPVEAMRAKLSEALPGVRALAGTAQALPLGDASLDAVVCAQAFHWFASAQALQEFHRVLRPGGRLGLVWNVRDESVDWVAELTAIMTPYEGDAPRFYKGDWRRPFEAPGQRWFGPLQETRWPYVHRGTPQDVVVNRTMSVSFIAALPKPEQARVRERIEALIARHPALRGQALVDSPYTTQAYAAEKLA